MNKKLGLVFLLFAGISGIGMASDGPKKYAFGLVQQAAEDYNNKINSLKAAYELEIGLLQTKVALLKAELENITDDTPQKLIEFDEQLNEIKKLLDGKLSLSDSDLYKLKYLLGHVVAT